MYNIRLAEAKDVPRIIELLGVIANLHHVNRPDIFKKDASKCTFEEVEEMLSNDELLVLVEVDENDYVLGYSINKLHKEIKNHNLLSDNKVLFIDDLCFDENYRGHGLGKIMIDYIFDYAKDNTFTKVELNVYSFNEGAIHFYKKLGFREKTMILECIIKD